MILFADGWDVGWSLPIISLLFTIKCWLTCDVLPSPSLYCYFFLFFLCDILPVVGMRYIYHPYIFFIFFSIFFHAFWIMNLKSYLRCSTISIFWQTIHCYHFYCPTIYCVISSVFLLEHLHWCLWECSSLI